MRNSAYFEAQTQLEVSSRVEDLMCRCNVSVEDLAEKMNLEPRTIQECIDDGEKLTVSMLAEILYHLGYGVLFTTKPLSRSNYEQAQMWEES